MSNWHRPSAMQISVISEDTKYSESQQEVKCMDEDSLSFLTQDNRTVLKKPIFSTFSSKNGGCEMVETQTSRLKIR